jgi:hypothetical protein
MIDAGEKVMNDQDRFKKHGAVHLGQDIANYEKKNYLGQGNLINGAVGHNSNRDIAQEEKFRRADSMYTGPAGSSLGIGRMQYDGTLVRNPSQQPIQYDNGGQMSPT